MRMSLLPVAHMLGHRITRREPRSIASVAAGSWEIAPAETTKVPRAYFLPGQLERVTGWAFTNAHPGEEMEGGHTVTHAPTRAFVVNDAWLIDGVLYKGNACSHLRPRAHRIPRLHTTDRFERGAICCTPGGNRYFGTWLMDDCPLYALALAEGQPVTTDPPMSAHARAYEEIFEMRPARTRGAFFRELVVFEDIGQNRSKRARFAAMRDKVRARGPATPHPGVFLVRGRAGDRRVLRNEIEIAERLRDRRGFRIVDPMQCDVPTILEACIGARVIAGVEGSGMVHGLFGLEPGGAILTLQPPDRFVNVYKHLADRDDQRFAFVVGRPEGRDFRVDPEEVERTLDLLPG